jgi:DNA repair ATPase RecN
MYKELEKKVKEIDEKLEDADDISSELVDEFYELEKELEDALNMCFEYEEDKLKKLLKKLNRIKKSNDIQ